MKTTTRTTVTKDRKAMLSLLWIFVMFNFTYADILLHCTLIMCCKSKHGSSSSQGPSALFTSHKDLC